MRYEIRYRIGDYAQLYMKRHWWSRWQKVGLVDISAILALTGTKPFTLVMK